ncbi:hypothetical protein K491DRAFT_241903 [Lophiostoma macrostomum CBS 122681]|uniref:Uncharacterized protein n=1 Tax=Lophiostoma macrostomum CBS 122681 TaxID=1314788 RepID=A0A6A6SKX9_9PLEO|nr:hypothetical protein K491DRAFT_241903 [Lophiostoma macrostomum CBS 122681]
MSLPTNYMPWFVKGVKEDHYYLNLLSQHLNQPPLQSPLHIHLPPSLKTQTFPITSYRSSRSRASMYCPNPAIRRSGAIDPSSASICCVALSPVLKNSATAQTPNALCAQRRHAVSIGAINLNGKHRKPKVPFFIPPFRVFGGNLHSKLDDIVAGDMPALNLDVKGNGSSIGRASVQCLVQRSDLRVVQYRSRPTT